MKTHNVLFTLLLLLAGCSAEEMTTVATVSSGPYQITVLAPGGVLKSGENTIAVQVSESGQLVNVQDAKLMYFMPQMGAMPYMEVHAQFTEPLDGANLNGTIKFNMGGSWNAKIEMTTPTGPVNGSFQTHVEERE